MCMKVGMAANLGLWVIIVMTAVGVTTDCSDGSGTGISTTDGVVIIRSHAKLMCPPAVSG